MNSRIEDSQIMMMLKFFHQSLKKAIVEKGADVGPFARLRPKAHLKEKFILVILLKLRMQL